ncbi:hypothetical protein A2U01_0060050 [Trifolium medium]|uniref:Uncharacterized protein n=1 Tax=Trifolium medium TaxID=97028 RepID=A0A392RQB4_9FABA|nr:hypothetical protein [Trifolium medium]
MGTVFDEIRTTRVPREYHARIPRVPHAYPHEGKKNGTLRVRTGKVPYAYRYPVRTGTDTLSTTEYLCIIATYKQN